MTRSRQSRGMRMTAAPAARASLTAKARIEGASLKSRLPSEIPRTSPFAGKGPFTRARSCAARSRGLVGAGGGPMGGSLPNGRGGPSGPLREGAGRTGGGCSHGALVSDSVPRAPAVATPGTLIAAVETATSSAVGSRRLTLERERVAPKVDPVPRGASQRGDQHQLHTLGVLEGATTVGRYTNQHLDRTRLRHGCRSTCHKYGRGLLSRLLSRRKGGQFAARHVEILDDCSGLIDRHLH